MYDEFLKTELKRQLQDFIKERTSLMEGNKKKQSEETIAKIEKLDFKIQYIEDQLKYF